MATTQTPEQLTEILDRVNNGDGEGVLEIIANYNLDLTQVEDLFACHFNDSWMPRIQEKLREGYVVFRIQTEWTTLSGHATMIYMAKLKQE